MGSQVNRASTSLVIAATAAMCVLVSAIAVGFAKPVGQSDLSALIVIAYNDKHPHIVYVILAIAFAFWLQRMRMPMAIVGATLAGGVLAQAVAAWIWGDVPDYLVLMRLGIIANVADLVIIGSALVLIVYPILRISAGVCTEGLRRD